MSIWSAIGPLLAAVALAACAVDAVTPACPPVAERAHTPPEIVAVARAYEHAAARAYQRIVTNPDADTATLARTRHLMMNAASAVSVLRRRANAGRPWRHDLRSARRAVAALNLYVARH